MGEPLFGHLADSLDGPDQDRVGFLARRFGLLGEAVSEAFVGAGHAFENIAGGRHREYPHGPLRFKEPVLVPGDERQPVGMAEIGEKDEGRRDENRVEDLEPVHPERSLNVSRPGRVRHENDRA